MQFVTTSGLALCLCLAVPALAQAQAGQSEIPDDPVAKFRAQFPNLPEEAVNRKERSVRQLQAEDVPVNAYLPVIETGDDIDLPSKEAILDRATALLVVALRAEGLEAALLDPLIARSGVETKFTPAERAFMADSDPSDFDNTQFSWRYESACVLLWSLGLQEEMGRPDKPFDVGPAIRMLRDLSRDEMLAKAQPRSEAEVLDAADLIYRYRWALVDARINGREPPAGLNPSVAMERHWALNWLVRHEDTAWDDITLDT